MRIKSKIFLYASFFSLLLSSINSTALANELTDGEIVAIYNQVNSFDIETAYLGQLLGNSELVKELAAMVATDHTGVRQLAHNLANRVHVTPALPASRQSAFDTHFNTIGGLRKLSGEDFDQAYLKHEFKFHTEAMNAIKNILLPATSNDELKAHFESVLPHFKHHIDETVKVAKQLGIRVTD